MSLFVLRLYITGRSAKSLRAIANLRRFCEEVLADQYQLSIVDVLEAPEMAEEEKILATPTLVKVFPPPCRRVIGDLSDREKLRCGLDLDAVELHLHREEAVHDRNGIE